jgi:adenylate cyclase
VTNFKGFEPVERRLTAILVADVVGYSRLMGEDEAGTLARLKAHRKELVEPEIAARRGRIVKLMGDGILVEFASVVDALECAVAVQRGMAERTKDEPEGQRFAFRIGVNLGDVMIDEQDIYGNGVNVAARLEALAEPGGICISGRVLDQVEKNVDAGFTYLGPQSVKNIEKPVNAYKVLLDPQDAGKIVGAPKPHLPQRWRWAAVGAVLALVIAAGGATFWLRSSEPEVEPASVSNMAFPLPEKPSIAVLPFDNLSGDPEQEYFADGLTEEIITTLSKTPNLFVIARNSTFTYKGKAVPVKQVAEELGVRYVLEGSVQRSGDRIRINAQLIDALEGHHIWAERYDREFDDIFALQDDVTQKIMIALQVELTEGEELRLLHARAVKPKAFEYMQKSRLHYNRFTKEDNAIARELAAKAAEISPDYPDAWAWMAWMHLADFRLGWSADREESFKKAVELAAKAYGLDPTLAVTNGVLASLNVMRGRYVEAISNARTAVELSPSNAQRVAGLGWVLCYAGYPEEAIPHLQRAMRLSPYYPAWFVATLGLAYMMTGDYANAVTANEELIKRKSLLQFGYARLAAVHAVLGNKEKAKDYAAELLKIKPDFTITGRSKVLVYQNQEDRDWELNALRRAGLPD